MANKSDLQRSPSAVTAPSGSSDYNCQLASAPSPIDEASKPTGVEDAPRPIDQTAIFAADSKPEQQSTNPAETEPSHATALDSDLPETATSSSQMSKRDSAVSPLARDRTQFSSISSTVSAKEDLPCSVVGAQQRHGTTATVASLAHVIQKKHGDGGDEV